MIQRGLFLFFFVCLSAHAVFGHQNVLAGAKIDRVTGDFAPFVGGNQDLIQNNMVQNPAPLVGHPPMLHAKVSADASSGVYPPDERSINFYEQASKDRVPNTVYHSVSTYGEKIFAVGGLTASNTVDKSFQYFDTIELRWINLTADVPNVPTLWGHCSAVYLDYLILYGGRSDANANTPVWNTAFYVLNLVNYTEGFFTVPSNISFTIQDHTCYVSDDNSYNVGFISIGGRGLFRDATEPYDLIIHFDADTIIDPLTSSVPSYNTSACGYARFGSDGDFWIQDYENGLSQLFYFMIGGFQGFDINGDLVAIPTWSDGFILLYDALGDDCYTFNIHEAPFPYFPGPKPINRYSFNTQWIYTVQKENISLANDPFVTVDTIGNADGTLVPNGLFQFTSTTPLNKDQDPILEYDGELHLGGGHFGGYARLPIPDFDNIFAFEIWFRANSSNSNATKILDIGQRFDLPPYSLASFTCGLLLNDDLTLTAYITGSKDLIVLNSLRETIENTINEIEAHPKRNAYASFVTTTSQIIPQALHHVAVNFNHRDQILQIFVDGQLEGETVLIPDTLPISNRGEFVYVGRSLNNNEAFGDFYLNGTVTEIRFYDRPLAKAEIEYSISRGPDITPLARGYHAVFEYENIVFFAGGYNPETDANLRPYNDAWSIDGSYDHYLNDPNNIVFIVDRTGPALETLEFPAFVQTEAVRLPMNRPNGYREDLYART